MSKIICLVGESGSGKSTIAEELEKCGLKSVVSFTTRKKRYPGETGHIFTTKKQYECNKANNTIVAETLFDKELYWTTKGQLNEDCVYVIDPVGVKELKEKVKDAEIVVIYLNCNQGIRYSRMMDRGDGTRKSEIAAVERMKHDRKAFKIVECNFCINANRSIGEVLKDVKSIIDMI